MTIILTPELAEIRIEARKIFPNHDFLPGDDCPIGQKVIRSNGEMATVMGCHRPDPTSGIINGQYWWQVRLDSQKLFDNMTKKEAFVLDWPPTLRKA